jgi:6-pyruvoyltetrahydropterin/6-carboxytetrahydropterin synthase
MSISTYDLTVKSEFSAAHRLVGYRGKCEELHGHNWKVEVVVSSGELDAMGMVIDFKLVKNKLNKVLKELDHKYLNDIAYFRKTNPTSENIARFIYAKLNDKLRSSRYKLYRVTIGETENNYVTYRQV